MVAAKRRARGRAALRGADPRRQIHEVQRVWRRMREGSIGRDLSLEHVLDRRICDREMECRRRNDNGASMLAVAYRTAGNTVLSKLIDEWAGEDEVKEPDELKSYPQWDSLSVLSVIAMLDANYGINLRAKEFENIQTAGDLWNLVQARKPS